MPRPRQALGFGLNDQVVLSFVIDTTGTIDFCSFRVLRETSRTWTESVLEALLQWRFRPATVGGHSVRYFTRYIIGTGIPEDTSVLALPIRVHIVRSPHSTALNGSRDSNDVATLLRTANQVWRAAGIQWVVESIRTDTLVASAAYDSTLAGQKQSTFPVLLSPFLGSAILRPGWNLFLVSDGGRVFGGFFRTEVSGIVLAEQAFGIPLPPDGRGGATLAHELGHSLGLEHVPCDSTRNIMANGCWVPTQQSSLTPDQVQSARKQAMMRAPITYDIP
jgi:hypothetical protein